MSFASDYDDNKHHAIQSVINVPPKQEKQKKETSLVDSSQSREKRKKIKARMIDVEKFMRL